MTIFSVSAINGGEVLIGNNTAMVEYYRVVAHNKLQIGNNTMLASNVSIVTTTMISVLPKISIRPDILHRLLLRENTWIGADCILLRDIKICNNCVVAVGCVIKGEISDNHIVIQTKETKIKMIKR